MTSTVCLIFACGLMTCILNVTVEMALNVKVQSWN